MTGAGAHRRVQRVGVGALEDEAAFGGFVEEIVLAIAADPWASTDAAGGKSGERGKMLRTIGLMSGTSLDGVDAAWLDTDGERIGAFGPTLTVPYDDRLRADLRGSWISLRRLRRTTGG